MAQSPAILISLRLNVSTSGTFHSLKSLLEKLMKTSKKKHRTSLNTVISCLHTMALGFQIGKGREDEIISQNNPTLIKAYPSKENSGHKWVHCGIYQTFKEEILAILSKLFSKME